MPKRRAKPKLTESDYLYMILRLVSLTDVQQWLADNPPPPYRGKYAWAYEEMIIGERINFVTRRKLR